MIKAKTSGDKYVEQLTWLRGIAAFFVIVSHTLRATEVTYSPQDESSNLLLMSFLDLGYFGVVLFFALSGCTLYISNAERMKHNDIVYFYIKRVFRIWPAFLVSLAVYIGFSYIFAALYVEPQGHWVEKQYLSSYTATDILSYLTLTFNITGTEGIFNNAYWSLPVEFQYYIIFPILIYSLRYTGMVGPVLISVALLLLPKLGLVNFDDNIVFRLAFSFCGGVLVGYLYKNYSFRINAITSAILLLAIITLASAIVNSYITLPDIPIIKGKLNWYGGFAIVAVFIVLITEVNIHNKIESFLKHYGTISYSTYLYHNIFVAISVLCIIRFEIYDSNLRLLTTFLITFIASYVIASISYKYIETPFISIGRKYSRKKTS